MKRIQTELRQNDLAQVGSRRLFGLHANVIVLGVVSFLTDVSSEMIYPIIPVFLTAVLGAKGLKVAMFEGGDKKRGQVHFPCEEDEGDLSVNEPPGKCTCPLFWPVVLGGIEPGWA